MTTVFERSYKINRGALQEYGRTTQAGGVSPIIQGNQNELTNGVVLAKFLKTVDGDGVCRVEYRHSQQFEAVKLSECGLTHSRVYPVEHYTCAFACLPLSLRVLALHRDYFAFDLSKCYHYIALGLTKNEESKRVLTQFLTSGGDRMQQIAEFYGKDYGTVKKWFHAFSNNKQKSNWLKESNIEATHEYIDEWIAVQNSLTDEFCKMYPKAFKALGRQKPTLRSYVNQCEEAKARAAMEAHLGNGLGPPMHDGISVLKHGLEEPELIAEKLSEVVSEALGYTMIVHHEVRVPEQLQNICSYSRADIVSNHKFEYETKEEFKATLDALATQLSRYFVCMIKMETGAVVELEYSQGSDRISKHIIRTSAKTTQTHPGALIVTQVDRVEATDKDDKPILGPDKKPVFVYKPKKHEPLLSWYIKDARRREKHRIGVYFTQTEERKHPNDLNVPSGLPYDERFENEPIQERTAFVDPFDEEPDWKTLDRLDFLLWHMKYNLHDGDSVALAYTIQLHEGGIRSYRIKSGVLILFTGVQGTGKTAVFGQNESGPGVYSRIYGDCGMQINDIDTRMKDFNADSCGKPYCLLEEANPGKNTNNNNKLKELITGGRQRIERKCIGPFHVGDCRSFIACSQDTPFKIEQGDRRFVVNRTRSMFSPTGVKNGEITQEEFVEFGRKLDRTKNDNEVAYELFAMVMRLDLSGFDKTRLPVTAAKTEQQNETSFKVAAWIERVAKLEFYDHANQFEEYFEFENGKILSLKTVRLSVLFQRYKIWHAAAYPGSWLEPRNENSFAKSITKIPNLVNMKKKKICNLYTVLCPEYVGKETHELIDDDAEPEAKRQKSADF